MNSYEHVSDDSTRRRLRRWARCLICGLTLLSLLLPHDAWARGLNDVMREAVQARNSGDLERTVQLLREAHKIQPAPEILNNLGKILEQMGRYREAYDAYKLVADNPAADQSLRALDSSRLGALQPKLNKAWLKPKLTPEDATVLIDGEPTGLPPGIEFGVTHGQHTIQVEHPEIQDILIRFGRFPVDVRTDFVVDLRSPGDFLARLDLGSRPRPKEVRINGKAISGDLDRPGSVLLPPGTYDVVAVGAFDAFGRKKITLKSGDVATLPQVDLATSAGRRPGASGGPVGGNADAPEISVSRERIEKPTGFMDVAPWVGVGLGALTTGAGAVLVAGLQSEKNTLKKQLEASSGSQWLVNDQAVATTPLTYAEAQAEQDRLNQENQRATLVIGLGAGVLVGSLVWSFIVGGDDEDELANGGDGGIELSPLVVSPGGLALGGRF